MSLHEKKIKDKKCSRFLLHSSFFQISCLARRLTIYVVLASTFISLFTSAFQLYEIYLNDVDSIDLRLNEIEISYAENIASRVWVANQDELEQTLNGILRLPDIVYIEVYEESKLIAQQGNKLSKQMKVKKFNLKYSFRHKKQQIGQVYIQASLKNTYQHVLDQAITIIVTNGIKTFLVTTFILFIFYHLVAKHLLVLGKFAKTIDIDSLDNELVLNRKSNDEQEDELDHLVNALMSLQMRLKSSLKVHLEDQQNLRRNEKQQRQILDSMIESVVSIDEDGIVCSFNLAATALFGYKAEEIIGKNVSLLMPDFYTVNHDKFIKNYIQSGKAKIIGKDGREVEGLHQNKTIFPIRLYVAELPADANNKRRFIGTCIDITKFKQQEEKIVYQGNFDSLTNLPNRFLSLDRLNHLLNEAKRNKELIAVLFLDLDDFKKINDSLGHITGDKLLIEAANRLNNIIRAGDTVGRLGGDEFIILLGNLNAAKDIQPIAENIIKKFREPFVIDGRELLMSISVGISICPDDGDNSIDLLRKADSAMYFSKENGRNTYSFFTAEMNENILRRLALEEQMYGALERGEFAVFYQPKYALNSGKIMGAEALVRWNNPTLGFVPPDEFISIAEQTNIILPLGEFVLNQALEMTAAWVKDIQTDFSIAVNLSPCQFRNPQLVSYIENTMQQYGLNCKHLEMEITEGVLLSGHDYIDKALTQLNQLDINIAMDDFGTGYSSLSYLRNYPFNILKIDRTFVNDIIDDKSDRELTLAAIAMSHALQVKVVAEGIETQQQLDCLKEMGCDYGQGYFFSKPIPAEDFTRLLIAANR